MSTNKGKTSVTAVQDWLNIRSFDPRRPVRAFICALRGTTDDNAADRSADVAADLVLSRPGIERC
ncbi:hypothetical protein A5662_17360 [Mycobacteriaceae bacterium 1482268.1]|nr:hypothetical protein A5662_17360 [Mycobacteriaceae bacterium 1482268.1]